MSALLEVERVSKAFSGIPVLKGVSFSLAAGRVLGIVGENGAGKSTLMNVLGGVVFPDAGECASRAAFRPRGPAEAMARGVAYIHQELNLLPNLSVAENLFLARLPRRGLLVDRRRLEVQARERLLAVGLDLSPRTLVGDLGPGARQLVEVARALAADARVVILDEPTTSLAAPEAERLFALVRRLRDEGRSLVYISHALGDVLRLADDVLVLRDGEVVGAGPAAGFDEARLITLMVGRSVDTVFPAAPAAFRRPGPRGVRPRTRRRLPRRERRRPARRGGGSRRPHGRGPHGGAARDLRPGAAGLGRGARPRPSPASRPAGGDRPRDRPRHRGPARGRPGARRHDRRQPRARVPSRPRPRGLDRPPGPRAGPRRRGGGGAPGRPRRPGAARAHAVRREPAESRARQVAARPPVRRPPRRAHARDRHRGEAARVPAGGRPRRRRHRRPPRLLGDRGAAGPRRSRPRPASRVGRGRADPTSDFDRERILAAALGAAPAGGRP